MAFNRKKEALDYRAVLKELKENGPQRLYLLWGEEDYLIADFIRRLREACSEGGAEDFNVHRLDGQPALPDIEEAVNAMPFFGGRTFLELHGFDVNACRDEKFAALLGDIPEWCTVVILLPTGALPDGRLNIIKSIKKNGKALEFTAQEKSLLYNWIRRRVESHGKRIGQAAMERLVFLSGNLMNQLIPEIEKICGYAPGEEVTAEDVEALAHHIPEAEAFEMTEHIAGGDFDGAADILTELLAGDQEPMAIFGAIGWQMRRLYAAKVCDVTGKGAAYYRQLTGDYHPDKTMKLAEKFSLEELAADVRNCAEYLMRTREQGAVLEELDALKELLIRFAMEGKHAKTA